MATDTSTVQEELQELQVQQASKFETSEAKPIEPQVSTEQQAQLKAAGQLESAPSKTPSTKPISRPGTSVLLPQTDGTPPESFVFTIIQGTPNPDI